MTKQGVRIGDRTLTTTSDDVYEQLTEAEQVTFVTLNHEWRFDVPPGSKIWFHHESHRTDGSEGEAFFYFMWAGAADPQWAGQVYDTTDPNRDFGYRVSTNMNGTVTVQLTDNLPVEAIQHPDTIWVDQLWIRVVP
jgi:hypothetical protein